MAFYINNPEADALMRKFAGMAGVDIADAIVIAMREAIAARRKAESPLDTVALLRAELGVVLTDKICRPLPRQAYNEMWAARPEVEQTGA